MNNQKTRLSRLVVLGLGLIGGSVAKACNKLKCYQLEAFDSNPDTIKTAIEKHIIDNSYRFNSKLSDNDLVLISAPLFAYQELIKKIIPNLSDQTIIFDIGSLKSSVENQATKLLEEKIKNFVPCHPIAGSEKNGLDNSDSNLFLNRKLIITPNSNTRQEAINKISRFWERIGSQVEFMDAKEHDKIFALVSHLPQFLSFVIANLGDNEFRPKDKIFQKHTRLENSNKKNFQNIFNLNKANLIYYLELLTERLILIKEKLANDQYQEIINFLEENLSPKLDHLDCDQEFLDQPWFISRLILVCCLTSIKDVKPFSIHAGQGFKDFTAILSYLKPLLYNKKSACEILAKHKRYLIWFLSEVQSYIINYYYEPS